MVPWPRKRQLDQSSVPSGMIREVSSDADGTSHVRWFQSETTSSLSYDDLHTDSTNPTTLRREGDRISSMHDARDGVSEQPLPQPWVASSFPNMPPPVLVPPSFSTTLSSAPPPQVAHSCLLIPVGLAVWWYWTKRTAHQVLRVVLPLTNASACATSAAAAPEDYQCHMGEPDNSQIFTPASPHRDQFHSWEDVVEQDRTRLNDLYSRPPQRTQPHHEHHQPPSLRFVRWIKGKNYARKQGVEVVSRRTLFAPADPGVGGGGGIARSTTHGVVDHLRDTPILTVDDEILDEDSTAAVSHCRSVSSLSVANHDNCSRWECIEDVTGVELCDVDNIFGPCRRQQPKTWDHPATPDRPHRPPIKNTTLSIC